MFCFMISSTILAQWVAVATAGKAEILQEGGLISGKQDINRERCRLAE